MNLQKEDCVGAVAIWIPREGEPAGFLHIEFLDGRKQYDSNPILEDAAREQVAVLGIEWKEGHELPERELEEKKVPEETGDESPAADDSQ